MGERKRDILLSSVKSGSEFCAFVKSLMLEYGTKFGDFKGGHGRKLTTGVSELLQEINHKLLNTLWVDISKLSVDALQSISGTLNTAECEESEMMDTHDSDPIAALEGVCMMILSSLKLEEPTVTKDLLQTLTLLHGSIFDLHTISPTLASCICVICEEWWKKNLESRDTVCLNAITHLLALFLQNHKNEKLSSIYQMQGCLSLFDFKKRKLPSEDEPDAMTEVDYAHETTEELRNLLLACFSHHSMWKDDGRKFLSGVMLLHEDLMKDAHAVITNNIKPTSPTTSASKSEALGHVYFQAWRMANEEKKEKFEEICIQDIMYRTVHAPRMRNNNLFLPLRLMLNGIVCNKGAVEVRHMVTRLYSPIIWRSLKANNAMVRANAASLLIDAFPLEEEDSNKPRLADNEEFMQRQYEALDNMILDDYPQIRVIGILGLCNILRLYWDAIPASIIAILCRKLFNDLAFDASVDVRQATFQGAVVLLDTPCSHILLGKLLPGCVGKCIHDTSEKVRIAVADALLVVKQTSTISFWSVCPVPNIMAQLEVDTAASVSRRLVKLLFRSFLPETDSKQSWVERCVTFYKKRVNAARKFYMFVESDLSFQETAEFLNLIGLFVYNCVTTSLQQENASSMDLETSSADDTTDENTSQSKNPIDAEIMAALLDTACILWKSLDRRTSSSKPEGRDRKLVKTVAITYSRMLHVCFKVANDERCLNAVLLLSSHLPPASLPVFSKVVLPKLRSLPDDAPDSHYSMLIECMCAWNWTKQALGLIREWLLEATDRLMVNRPADENAGQEKSTNSEATAASARRSVRLSKAPDKDSQKDEGKSEKRKKKKAVKFTGITHESRPGQAFKYLACFLDIQSRQSFKALKQEGCYDILVAISHNLERCQDELVRRISSQSAECVPWTNDLLVKAVDMRFNLLSVLHLHQKSTVTGSDQEMTSKTPKQSDMLESVSATIDWYSNVIDLYEESSKVKLNTSVLTTKPAGLLTSLSLYRTVFNTCLASCLDFLSCGIQVFDKVEDVLLRFCNSGINLIEYIGHVTKLMFQLHEHKVMELAPELKRGSTEDSTNETLKIGSKKNEKLIQIFDVFVGVLLKHSRQNQDSFLQVFRHEVRAPLRSMIREQHYLHSICSKRVWYDVLSRKTLSAILADLFHEVRSGFSKRDRIIDLPVFSASMLSALCATSAECGHVCEICILDLANDESTFSIEQQDQTLQSFAHLLYTLSKDGKNKEAANFCITEMSQVSGFKQMIVKVEAGEGFDTDVEPGRESTRKDREDETEEEDVEPEEILVLEAPEEQGMLFNDEEFVI